MIDWYYLKRRKPVKSKGAIDSYARFDRNPASWRVRKHYDGEYHISTVLLPIVHGANFFETMVFRDGEGIDQARAAIHRQALKNHRRLRQKYKYAF